jgi:bacillithiol biosynthesis cysteine-adding enzyme BshC
MAVTHHPFSKFRSFSRLFSVYAGEFDPLSSFFAGDYRDPRQRGQIAVQVADHYATRGELTSVLEEQNRAFGAGDETFRNIERLAGSDAVAVVTGQQLGLFLGPLYTIYKTVTAIQLARRIERDTGRSAVPVFWLEGEDHDLEEVSSTALFSGNEVHRLRYSSADADSRTPVGRIVFDESIASVVDQLEALLPPTDFRDDVMTSVRNAYRPGATFLEAFARLMGSLFADYGLVFISGDDVRFKRLAAPLFRKEIREYRKSESLLKRTSGKLAEPYHIQVQTQPINLFLISEKGRRSIVADGDGFVVREAETRFTTDELLAIVDEHPESFSPNVVMRPIFQDAVLPTAAYVAGPGEVAYFAQYRQVYEWAGVPMPIVYPRASLTLVESKVQKILDRYETDITALEEQLEKVFHELVVDAMEVDAEAIFERAGRHLHDAINTVLPAIESVDKSLARSAEASRVGLFKEWDRLKDRVIKAEKRRNEQMQEQLARAQTNLFPEGALQERLISPLYFMNKYGTDFIHRLVEEVDMDTSAHQIFRL